MIIEENGQLTSIEIKSSQTYNSRLTKGLKIWQKLTDSPFDRQFLVYAGEQEGDLEWGKLLNWYKALEIL